MKRPRRINRATGTTTLLLLVVVLLALLICHASASSAANAAGVASCRRWGVSMAAPCTTRWNNKKKKADPRLRHNSVNNDEGVAAVTNFWDVLAIPTSRRRSLLLATSRPFWVPTAHAKSSSSGSSSSSTTRTTQGDIPHVDELPELGPVGKAIAGFISGTIEIFLSTAIEYMGGYVSGYALGTLTGLPAFLFKSTATQGGAAHHSHFWNQVRQRTARLHGKSHTWASSWAAISAAFGGFRVTTKVLRGGKQDEWSTIFSSMAAGAWFARKEGPYAMVQKAVLYGGLMYILNGNLFEKKEPFQYTEETIEF